MSVVLIKNDDDDDDEHISGMHSKFALRPHHVWKYHGRHPISDR